MKLDRFIGDVLVEAQGCTDTIALNAVRKSLVLLCQRASVWRDSYTTKASSPDVYLDAPTGARVATVQRVLCDGRLLAPALPDSIEYDPQKGRPEMYYRQDDSTLILHPAPDAKVELRIDVTYGPTIDCDEVPDDLGNRYFDLIVKGALMQTLAMAGKPWANPTMAGVYAQFFDSGTDGAKIEESRGRVRSKLRTKSSWM